MNKLILIFVGILSALAYEARAQENMLPVMDFTQFERSYFHQHQNDTLYVFNFWATWCSPCVKELPYFEKAFEEYKNRPIRIILVSLDSRKKLETQLLPFLEKRKLQNEVILLSHPNANEWIDKVSPIWSGAIPATVLMRANKKLFFEQSFEEQELLELINRHIIN